MKKVTNNNLRTKETLNQDREFTNLKAKAFILNNIDLDGYDLENTAENLYNTFISEYG
jgi:UDP-N-acetylmuramate-alanine ligase